MQFHLEIETQTFLRSSRLDNLGKRIRARTSKQLNRDQTLRHSKKIKFCGKIQKQTKDFSNFTSKDTKSRRFQAAGS